MEQGRGGILEEGNRRGEDRAAGLKPGPASGKERQMKMEPASGALDYGIVVEKDVDVPMRDGAHLKADVFRPDAPGAFPAILNLGPYQKDKLSIPPTNLEEDPTPLMNCFTGAHFRPPRGVGISPNSAQEPPATSGFLIEKSGHRHYTSGRRHAVV